MERDRARRYGRAVPTARTVDRARWTGLRWHRHGLGTAGPVAGAHRDDLLLLGIQDGRRDAARHALATRGIAGPVIGPDEDLVAMWSIRGAPHVHRRADLGLVRAALTPLDTDDGGPARTAMLREIADALAAVVTGPTAKGEISTALTARVPRLATWCARCGADHVPDGDVRAAAVLAGLVLAPGPDTVLTPGPGTPDGDPGAARAALLAAWFRIDGPASRGTVRDWFGGDAGAVAPLWTDEDDRVVLRLDGGRAELPEPLLDDLLTAPDAEGVALVPPHDPYLRRVDRTLLVPDRDRRSQVWRAVSAPGALLVDGEVAGTWRTRRDGTEVASFGPLPAAVRDAVLAEAVRVTGTDRTRIRD